MSRSLDIFRWIFYVNVVFLVLLSAPYIYTNPGPKARVATMLALVPISIMLIGAILLTRLESTLFDF